MKYSDRNLSLYRRIYNDRRDIMLYFFCEIKNNKLEFRKNIILDIIKDREIERKYGIDINKHFIKCIQNNNMGYFYWSSKIVLVKGELVHTEKNVVLKNIEILLEGIDSPYKLIGYNEEDDISDFINYYQLMKKMNELYLYNDRITSYRKYFAMEFYNMIKMMLLRNELFKNKKYYISEPNVFIKDYPMEYDFLIVNNGINKGVYLEDEVMAVVELKAGTLINKDISYLSLEKYNNKPLIYISGYHNKNGIDILKKCRANNIESYVFCVLNNVNSYGKFFASNNAIDFNDFINKVSGKW